MSLQLSAGDVLDCAVPLMVAGALVADKYSLVSIVGQGASSYVWSATDMNTGRTVAVKIMRHSGPHKGAARASRLSIKMAATSAMEKSFFLPIHDRGTIGQNQCLVMDITGPTIEKIDRSSDLFPLTREQFVTISRQLFMAVAFLHEMGIIHTDIKPENVTLLNDSRCHVKMMNADGEFYEKTILSDPRIKLIDLDNHCSARKRNEGIIGTRPYRSPEVFGELPWSVQTDIFSVGCTLAELHHGDLLIDLCSDDKYMALLTMEKVLGYFPSRMLELLKREDPFLSRGEEGQLVLNLEAGEIRLGTRGPPQRIEAVIDDPELCDLLKHATSLDPLERISAREALKHSYLSHIAPESHQKFAPKLFW